MEFINTFFYQINQAIISFLIWLITLIFPLHEYTGIPSMADSVMRAIIPVVLWTTGQYLSFIVPILVITIILGLEISRLLLSVYLFIKKLIPMA